MYDLARIDAASTALVGTNLVPGPVTGPGGKTWLGLAPGASAVLYQSTGVDREVYTVARCLASESPGPAATWLSIAEAIWNECRSVGVTPFERFTGARWQADAYEFTAGRYGEQHGRFASTSRTPNGRHVEAARQGRTSDLARGAARWLSLRTLDAGKQAGRNVDPADVVVKRWAGLGWQWVGPLAGVDSYRHALFAQTRPADTRAILAVIELGRAGKGAAEAPQKNINATAAVTVAAVVGTAVVGAKLVGG